MSNTVPQIAAHLIQSGANDLLAITLSEEKVINVLSAGNIDTATAIVMLGNALAIVYKEMPPEVLATTSLAHVLNNVGVVATNRVQQIMPEAFGTPAPAAAVAEADTAEVIDHAPVEVPADEVPAAEPVKAVAKPRVRAEKNGKSAATKATKNPPARQRVARSTAK